MGPVAAGVYGDPSAALTRGRHHRHERQDDDGAPARRRSCAPPAGRPAVIGTLSGAHTTPEAPELQARLAAFRDDGDAAVVMEVSSHALALHRVDGTRFAAAVFTNLGTDHLDLHGTVEEYFRAKARLFTPELAAVGVTNVDDAARPAAARRRADRDGAVLARPTPRDVVVAADRHAFTWRGRAHRRRPRRRRST